MKLQGIEITARNSPRYFSLCHLEGCPRSGECLRHVVVPLVDDKVTHGPAVYPSALRAQGGCAEWLPIRVVRYAWGFNPLFVNVLARDAKPLRAQIQQLLGSRSTYYRCNRGASMPPPAKQQQILDLFAKRGYTEGLSFAHYKDAINFSAH